MSQSSDPLTEILYISFNQDHQSFVCGTDSGFSIFQSDPFKESIVREFPRGGIGIAEMLFQCNVIALVGGGKNPRYDPRRVMIWDDHQGKCIGEFSFRSEIKAVRLRRDRVVVVLEQKVYVYNFADLKLLDQMETVGNPKGLIALSPYETGIILACPALQKGHVRVDLYDYRKQTFIPAHESELACLALNLEGTLLATASEKGTLVRVFETSSGNPWCELRRGKDAAKIHCINFNPSSTMLCVSSDHGTIHVFRVEKSSQVASLTSTTNSHIPAPMPNVEGSTALIPENTKSSFSFMKGVLPKYFSSVWSFAQFRLSPSKGENVYRICAFGAAPNSIVVAGTDGFYERGTFDLQTGGECKSDHHAIFIRTHQE